MVPVKIECGCGQRYAFDVEPVNGRMPAAIKCPACGMDGTAAANEAITYMLSLAPAATATPVAMAAPPVAAAAPAIAVAAAAPPIVASSSFAPAAPPLSAAAPAPAAARSSYAPQQLATSLGVGKADTWKWWYYILAGILIGVIDGWYIYETGHLKYIKGLLLSVLLIAVGIWDFQAKRKRK